MTEQISKLDVKTLEYVLSMLRNKREICSDLSDFYKRKDDMRKSEINFHKSLELSCVCDEIDTLIREQQEVA